MAAKISARIRMYRLNELGDCFLITFVEGASTSHMLIDCGSFRNSKDSIARLKTITTDIKKELNGAPLNVIIGTHQHNDHLSGFVHCEDAFRKMGVDKVWLSWLDDPQDQKAHKIGEAHNNLRDSLFKARDKLQASATQGRKLRSLEVLNDMLGFYGASSAKSPPELPANAVEILKQIGKEKPCYLKPGRILDVPGLPPGSVKVHVLGPPRDDDDALYRKDPRVGESYDHALASATLSASKFLAAVTGQKGAASREEEQYPFGERYKQKTHAKSSRPLQQMRDLYKGKASSWRTVDDDWLNQAEGLALYMDSFTNNSSLAMAIELCGTGKVLLFAADAQTGNWSSWGKVRWESESVSTDDLLARTILYKVGHHGSHNSTLVETFEKMNHPDLSALIPVHKKDPNIAKENGWKMPAKQLFKRIADKTSKRVLQMDNVNPASCNPNSQAVKAAWKKAGITPKITDLFVELKISDE
jgi:beta-lactamase superfamily II metal-dependent hydrolase